MATSMSSAFTAPDRRKKAVTYGKTSRLPSISKPAMSPDLDNDAPSPERPRKQSGAKGGLLKKTVAGLKDGGNSNTSRDTTESPDIWDMPLEDEFAPHPAKTTKKLLTKRRIPEEDTHVAASSGKTVESNRETSKPVQVTRKAESMRSAAPTATRQPKSLPQAKATLAPTPPTSDQPGTKLQLGKAGLTTRGAKNDVETKQTAQRVASKPKAVAQATTSIPATLKETKNTKAKAAPSAKTTLKDASKQPVIDPFDIPSSDDESHIPTPKPTRRAPKPSTTDPVKATKPPLDVRHKDSTESEDSEALKKRKRRGSVSSITAIKQIREQNGVSSLPQRSRKYQKKEDCISPGHTSDQPSTRTTTLDAQPTQSAINKPKRTRARVVPVLTQPPMSKGHSSPATLYGMLSGRQASKPSPIVEAPVDDETMYEIQDMTTPVRSHLRTPSGSITPRQKALFGSLLGTSSTTPMPSIGKLQLTDRKPGSLLGALSRSKSDMTPSAKPKKGGLITNLKHVESSSDDETSGGDDGNDSEEETEAQTMRRVTADSSVPQAAKSQRATDTVSDNMEMDVEAVADSQISQTASGFGNRARLTYAKARSYLQEANPEDNILMSMDLDDPITFGSQTRDSQTEDEEEASQVRPNHELKRQGQNTTFLWENEMLIDDISLKSSNSIRRTAILELCTKMMDEKFAHELLNSSLAHQFLKNLVSNGEVIFDVVAAVATIFLLQANPSPMILDQMYRSDLSSLLIKLLDNDTDLRRIAKNRSANLSRIAQESVVAFRSTVLESSIWSPSKPKVLTPQLVAVKALDVLALGLRKGGSTDSIIGQDTIVKLVNIAASVAERSKTDNKDAEHNLVLMLVFSILEVVSLGKQKQSTWSAPTLSRLAESMAVSFQTGDVLTASMAVKLCMNLTNNNPKACRQFSEPLFVQSLVQSIVDRLKLWLAGSEEAQRNEFHDTLLLSLGAMLNLTEHIDEARVNTDDGKQLIGSLVETFVEGSARSAQAVSMEETQSSVVVGYLGVLLGNMCLNQAIQSKIRAGLPNQRLTILVDMINEFIQVHEHANRKANQLNGDEDRETWQNFTKRIMLVVERLEQAEHV